MRRRLTTLGAAAGLVIAIGAAIWWSRSQPPRIIVLVSIDTIRRDHVSAYAPPGVTPPVRTPALDAIARAGVRFDAAEAPSPLTRPSHQTMLTGLWPPEHGVRDNHSPPLPPRESRSFETLAETLSARGWQCAAFVSATPLTAERSGLDAGFETYDEPAERNRGASALAFTERPADETVGRVLAWLGERRDRARPLFLWVHFFDPHQPYAPPAHYLPADATRNDAARYAGEVAFVDAEIRRLRDALTVQGIDPETAIFVVVGDHGEGLGEHGEATHGWLVRQSTLAIPLMMAGPGIPADRAVRSVVRLVDLRPTLLRAVGIDDAGPDAGADLGPLVGGGTDAAGPRPAYAESLYGYRECGWAQVASLRDERWKLIDVGPRRELYDLLEDPGETTDLAATRPDDVARLLAALDTFRRRESLARPFTRDGGATEDFGYGVVGAPDRVRTFLDAATNAKLRAVIDSMEIVQRADQGRRLLAARGYAQAAALFDQLLAEDPANPSLPYWRGSAEFHRFHSSPGDASLEEAARFALRAWELGGRTAPVRDLALSAMCLPLPAEAIQFAERSYEVVPPTPASRNAEANAFIVRGDWASALARLEIAVAMLRDRAGSRDVESTRRMLDWLTGSSAPAGLPDELRERAGGLLESLGGH